jgi:hypothetical protein
MGMKNSIFLNRQQLVEALQNPSAWLLIAVNLGLILAVVVWKWSIFDIVFLYWVENLIIGVINVFKMLFSSPDMKALTGGASEAEVHEAAVQAGQSPERARKIVKFAPVVASWGAKIFFIPFFIIHYGMFCYGHGVFVFSLFSDGTLSSGAKDATEALKLLTPAMLLAIGLLAASHLFSFLSNFLIGGEYKRTNPAALMMRPYGRIVVLHITIILGGMLAMAFGDPIGLLIVLIVLKTGVDLAMHQAERNKYEGI